MDKERSRRKVRERGSGTIENRNGVPMLVIYGYGGDAERVFTAEALRTWEIIGEGNRIYEGGLTVAVKIYELTFKGGECVTCTVVQNPESADLEASFFSMERRAQ